MAASLFKMPFDIDKTRVHQIYRSETLDRAGVETISCDEMKAVSYTHLTLPTKA